MMNNSNNPVQEVGGLSRFYGKVYGFMGVALALSSVTAFLTLNVFFEQAISFMNGFPLGYTGLVLVEFGLVILLASKAQKNPSLALGGFIVYSVLNGFTIALILATYTASSVVSAFGISAGMFIGLSAFGTLTKRDLSVVGRAAMSALIGVIIAMLVNVFFLHSSPVEIFISILCVLIFSGLTAYDNQRIRTVYAQTNGQANSGIALFLALQLYLDFINLFLSILRIFGSRN